MAYFIVFNTVDKIKKVYPIDKDKELERIGRLSDNDIILKGARVSRYHAELVLQNDGEHMIKDLHSSNGIKVNGNVVTDKILKDNDKLKIGEFFLYFKTADLSPSQLKMIKKQASSTFLEETMAIDMDDEMEETEAIRNLEGDFGTVFEKPILLKDIDYNEAVTEPVLSPDETVTLAEGNRTAGRKEDHYPSSSGSAETIMGAESHAARITTDPHLEGDAETVLIYGTPGTGRVRGSEDPGTTTLPARETMHDTGSVALEQVNDEILSQTDQVDDEAAPPGYRNRKNNLIQLFFKNNVITEEEMLKLLSDVSESSSTVCQRISKMSLSNRRGFIDTLKSYFGLPYIETDDEIIKMYQKTSIGAKSFQRCTALPVHLKESTNDNYLPVIMADPTDLQAIDELYYVAKKPVKPVFFSTTETIRKAISRVFHSSLTSRVYGAASLNVEIDRRDYSVEEVSDFPIIDMVNYFIHKAKMDRASDIHFEPTEHFFVVRNRIDGVLHEVAALPSYVHPEVVARLKIICDMNVAERRLPQDGRFSVRIQDKSLDVRISTFPTVHGEKMVLRLLEQESVVTDIQNLGMSNYETELFTEKIKAPYGMILLTGPTGSGKTTTLYAALSMLNTEEINILTVEDPVEYKIQGIYQLQANEKIGLTFASGLRTMLRQDPDVIMVGEIRDQETAEIAIRASLTGHIVFSTLHTNYAIGIILRLTDMGIDPFLVASALTLAVAQRLYRTICNDCRNYVKPKIIRERLQEEGITESRLKKLGLIISDDREYAIGKGCPRCRGTGYYGRRALFEMFNVTQEAKDIIISKDFTESTLKKLAMNQGMKTLVMAGRQVIEKDLTTFEEIIRVCGED